MMCLTYWNSFIFTLQDECRYGTYLRDCRNRENQSLPANCYHTKTDFIGPLIWESCQNENCNENSVAAACLAHQNILHSYPAVVLQTKYLPEKGGVSMFMQFMIFLWFPHTPNKEKGRRLPFFGPFPSPPPNGTNFQTFFYPTFFLLQLKYIYEKDFTLQKYHFYVLL